MLIDDGEMLINDGEMSISYIFAHLTIIEKLHRLNCTLQILLMDVIDTNNQKAGRRVGESAPFFKY